MRQGEPPSMPKRGEIKSLREAVSSYRKTKRCPMTCDLAALNRIQLYAVIQDLRERVNQ